MNHADLAASTRLMGPEPKSAVLGGIEKIVASGKAAGILTLDHDLQQKCREIGATFIATEIDVTLFARNIRKASDEARQNLQRGLVRQTGAVRRNCLERGGVRD